MLGKLILEETVQMLRAAGYAVERGYPQGKACTITQPVCAVNLQAADLEAGQITVLVQVIGPMALGCGVCEEAALDIGDLLSGQGAQCTVSACRQDGRLGLFCVDVRAAFAMEIPQITVDDALLNYVQSFRAWRGLDSTVTAWADAKWYFQMEEWIPAGAEEQALPEENFTLIRSGENGTETFSCANWTYCKRVWSPGGIRRICTGVADSMATE